MNKYIMMFVAAIALVSCSDNLDDSTTPSSPVKAGAEVQFGLSLESTRTIYGPEETTGGKTVFPIYWTNKDKVQIYSPDCAQGRNDAEYEVTPNATQPYADKLTKTGSYGVQWGNEPEAVFYSIYPSKAQGFEESGNDVIANLSVSGKQEAAAMLTGTTYYAADMNNIVMYAKSASTKAGDTVNLQYMPFSTVLDIQVNVDADGENSLFVESITVEAKDVNIVGDFDLTFPKDNATPSINPVGEGSNVVAMTFTVAPELDKTNSTLCARLGLMPISGISSLEGWKITLKVKEGDGKTSTYTKTLPATGALVAGKIHKIVLPSLTAKSEWTYDPAAWMPSLDATVDGGDYKKIYLTELSIPGAWYAGAPTKDGYQSTASISDLWNDGVRAFAVECRTVTGGRYDTTPAGIAISGTQSRGGVLGRGDHSYGGTRISTVIESIAKEIKKHAGNEDGEFGVLILSYADGGDDGHRAEDHNYFLQGVKKEIDTAITSLGGTDQHNIYNDEITSETIIQEVIGKLIIKVHVDYEIAKSDYKDDMPALISYVPHINQFNSDMEKTFDGYLSTPLFSKLYWQSWSNDYKTYTTTANTDFLWCGSSVNRTAPDTYTENNRDIPNYTQRLAMLNGMISHSQEIYKNSTHNVWFCFGCGGTQSNTSTSATNGTSFASSMNNTLLDIIKRKTYGGTLDGVMVAPDPSPLGIVLFNQCTNPTYKGPDIIKAIIEMNTKFKLKVYTSNDENGDENIDPFA